jgi:hypothetical protein
MDMPVNHAPPLSADVTGGVLPYTYQWSNGATTKKQTVCPTATTTYTLIVKDANGCGFYRENGNGD